MKTKTVPDTYPDEISYSYDIINRIKSFLQTLPGLISSFGHSIQGNCTRFTDPVG